jgi:hypothetical protein
MKEIITSYEEPITGVAISSPGAVNEKERATFFDFFKGGLPYCLNFSFFRTVELTTV